MSFGILCVKFGVALFWFVCFCSINRDRLIRISVFGVFAWTRAAYMQDDKNNNNINCVVATTTAITI